MGGPYLLPGGALPSLERTLSSLSVTICAYLRRSSCKRNLSERNITKSGTSKKTFKNQKEPRIPSAQGETLQIPGPFSGQFRKNKKKMKKKY